MKRLGNRRSPAGMSLADLLVVVVLIPLVSVAIVGCMVRQRGGDGSVRCSANLKSIGQAMLLYANENKQQYPRAAYQPGPVVIPTWGTGGFISSPGSGIPQPNDVTAAMYLLMSTEDLSQEVFVCPTSNASKWDYEGGGNTVENWSNWNGIDGIQKHLSYSMQNPYPDDNAVARGFKWDTSLSAEYVLFADINPGVSANTNVLTVRSNMSSADMRRGNSFNDPGDGQNILFGDGHVDFRQNPFAGIAGDNIYARRAGSIGDASSSVQNSPYDANDNVLLPTDN